MKTLVTLGLLGSFFIFSAFSTMSCKSTANQQQEIVEKIIPEVESSADLGPTSNIPSVDVKTLEGKTVNIQDYVGKGRITVISFWATWCSPCKRELDAISEIYPDWQEEFNADLVAVTIDDARSMAKVPALVETKGWEFLILADSKRELQKALNFQTVPQTFLIDQEGNIVYTHTGYNPGDELELEDEIKKLVK